MGRGPRTAEPAKAEGESAPGRRARAGRLWPQPRAGMCRPPAQRTPCNAGRLITVPGTLGVRELVGGVSWEAPLRATYTRGDYRKKEECQCRKLEEAMWGPASLAGGRW